MARPSRTAIRDHDPTFLWKLLVRILAILFAIVAIGTVAWAITAIPYNSQPISDIQEEEYYYNSPNDFYYGYTMLLPWILIALGLSVIWNVVNIIVLLARNRWIHPGANVGCDLILWLGLGVTAGIASVGAVSYLYYDDYYGTYDTGSIDAGFGGGIYPNGTAFYNTANGTQVAYCGDVSCDALNAFNALVRHVGIVVAVGCAFACIATLFHFALFISACRYTHTRRHSTYSARHTRAVTEEATQIARRMIADLTTAGPNGGFIPLNNNQLQQQPLLHRDPNEDPEMQMQRQPDSQQPMQPMQQQMIQQQQQQQRDDVPDTPETLHPAERWAVPMPPPVDRPVSGAAAGTHPALRY